MSAQAFYSSYTAPEYIQKRTSTSYETMSFDEAKKIGFWNKRLDRMLPVLPHGSYIAGGFLRAMIAGEDDRDGDIDFFFNSGEAFQALYNIIEKPNNEERSSFGWYSIQKYDVPINKLRVIDCTSDIIYRPNLQLVKLYWYDDPIHVIDNFDLTICQIAINKDKLFFNPQAIEDIKRRTIKIHKQTGSALSMFNRILKYRNKKYNIAIELFEEIENEAIKMLDKPNEINEYFYADKDEVKNHKRPVSFLKHAWEYLEHSPKSFEAYKRMMKNKKRPAKKITYSQAFL